MFTVLHLWVGQIIHKCTHEYTSYKLLHVCKYFTPYHPPHTHTTHQAYKRERYIHTSLNHQSIPFWSSLYSHGDDNSYSTPGDRCEVIFHTSSPGRWQAWDVPYSRQYHKYTTPLYKNIWGQLSRYLQTQPTHEGMWHIIHTTRYKGLHDCKHFAWRDANLHTIACPYKVVCMCRPLCWHG